MKNIFIKTFSFLFSFLISMSNSVLADSPVTATPFYKAYSDIEMVNYAEKTGILDDKIAKYLHDPSNSIDKKSAVINALSWSLDGKNNAGLYKDYLYSIKAIVKNKALGNSEPDASDKFCLAYLSILDDYDNPDQSINLLKEVRSQIKDSYTVDVILVIAKSQKDLFKNDAKKIKFFVQKLQNNNKLKQDLRPAAKKIILDYLDLYKSY